MHMHMHTRKKMMYELSDAAIILPGGNGTLDELFEMLTWNTLQIHIMWFAKHTGCWYPMVICCSVVLIHTVVLVY